MIGINEQVQTNILSYFIISFITAILTIIFLPVIQGPINQIQYFIIRKYSLWRIGPVQKSNPVFSRGECLDLEDFKLCLSDIVILQNKQLVNMSMYDRSGNYVSKIYNLHLGYNEIKGYPIAILNMSPTSIEIYIGKR